MMERGIDIKDLEYVIEYDIPKDISSQYQMSGRCGRENKYGKCFYICENDE